jgi:hypothetical protein
VYPFEALIEPPQGGLAQRSKVLLMHMNTSSDHRESSVVISFEILAAHGNDWPTNCR